MIKVATYIQINQGIGDPLIYMTDTTEQIEVAEQALRAEGITETEVWATPYTDRQTADTYDGHADYKTGGKIFAK